MRPIEPPDDKGLGDLVKIAENQDQYQTLPSRISAQGAVTTVWEFTIEERAAIAEGKNLYLEILTFNTALQPVMPWVDGFEPD